MRVVFIAAIVLALLTGYWLHNLLNSKTVHKNMDKKIEKVLMNPHGITMNSGYVQYNRDDISWDTATYYVHDTVYLMPKPKKDADNQNGDYGVFVMCDSATKASNAIYWHTQCELVKRHNEVMPEDSWPLPQLSADSCMVSFPL